MPVIYLCPTLNACKWFGGECQLWKHLKRNHADLLLRNREFYIDVQNSETVSENVFFKTSDKRVILVQIIGDNYREHKVQIFLRLLGDKKDARGYKYGVIISCGDLCLNNEDQDDLTCPVRNNGCGGIEVDLQTLRTIWKCRGYLKCTVNIDTIDKPSSKSKKIEREDSFILKQVCPNDNFFKEQNKEQTLSDCSSSRVEIITANDDLGKFKCAICAHYLTSGPVFKCWNCHSICHWCRSTNHSCTVCDQPVLSFRNEDLELERNLRVFPCKFAEMGCKYENVPVVLLEHEAQCQHCLYVCPQCQHRGVFANFEKHFRIAHPSIKQIRSILNHNFPPPTGLLVIHKYGIFLCTSTLTGDTVEWKVVDCCQSESTIFFECCVQISKRFHQQMTKEIQLEMRGRSNVHQLALHVQNIKPFKVKNAKIFINFKSSDESNV